MYFMIIYIRRIVLLGVMFLTFSCSKESPKEKAIRYLGYMDTFYFDLTEVQEKRPKKLLIYILKKKVKQII